MLINRNESALILVDVQQKLLSHIHDSEKLETRCAWLLNIANELDVPMLISEQYPEGLGSTTEKLQTSAANSDILQKTQFSFANEPTFIAFTKKRLIKQVILIGIEAHVCVLQSALSILDQGYQVFVVADAVGSRNSMDKDIALKRMINLGVQIVSAEMVVFEWLRCSGTKNFKNISQNYLKG